MPRGIEFRHWNQLSIHEKNEYTHSLFVATGRELEESEWESRREEGKERAEFTSSEKPEFSRVSPGLPSWRGHDAWSWCNERVKGAQVRFVQKR